MAKYEVKSIGTIINKEDGNYYVQLDSEYREGLKALSGFSHINVFWWFSEFDHQEARTTLQVAQPYVGAPDVMGVFATRSPIRPNLIALTACEILDFDEANGRIQIAFIDANDGTPVLDLKPYTPSLDRVKDPKVPNWCSNWPKSLEESGEFDWGEVFMY